MHNLSHTSRAPAVAAARPVPAHPVPAPPKATLNVIRAQLEAVTQLFNQLVDAPPAPPVPFQVPPRAQPFKGMGHDIALVHGREAIDLRFAGWPVRDQMGDDNCIAFSTLACVEHLLLADAHDKSALSVQFLVNCIKTKTDDPNPGKAYTYLHFAALALQSCGVLKESQVPYAGGIRRVQVPTPERLNAAIKLNCHYFYRDRVSATPGHAANLVYACLATHRRPVAITLPVFFDASSDTPNQTNWSTPAGMHHGRVHDVGANATLVGEHAVAVIGYQPETGHFVFRNSFGTRWGTYAPSTLPGPSAPQAGYGVVSAAYIDANCGELLQLW